MSFVYSNPFAPQRSTFSGSTAGGFQVLFGGLPLDVSESDLKDLLTSPTGLNLPTTTSVRNLHNPLGQFLGLAIVQVHNELDAEKIRREYSGQIIDSTFHLTVQHILPPYQSLPSPTPAQPFNSQSPSVAPPPPNPTAVKQKPVPTTSKVPPKQKDDGKPLGLKLLARLGQPGQGVVSAKQASLIATQRANLRHPGNTLLSRLDHPTPYSKNKKPVPIATATKAKVIRAKTVANGKMDVDQPLKSAAPYGKERGRPKTQVELDEEMRLYERERRFARG
ncbi:hypothetical protein M231_02373 [Tremella mesenterica]|uniref:RRM domain-containing protein n=1 Tax=Tremella mesenterica TaxID=5217 RepID=A0A4Q1BR54_TREME|nr:hypothetical protein M231_02373 [Tremella mesenterica]